MTATTETTAAAEVSRYVEEVSAHLASLAWLSEADRAELLDDLTQHLSEVAAEDETPLSERLGSAAAYADDLLVAAGLEAPAERAAPVTGEWAWTAVAAGWAALGRMFTEAGDLRPAWWILRGYLAASLLGALTGGGHDGAGHPGFPIPAVAGSSILGLLAVIVAVRTSVRWGKQNRPARRWIGRLSTAVLAVYAVVLLTNVGDRGVVVTWIDRGEPMGGPSCLTNSAGQVIENLYPYDAGGRLLDQVLLYDQTGRPLDNLCPSDFDRMGRPLRTVYGRDENGAPVINVFPRRQTVTAGPEEPEPFGTPTTTVAGPMAPPAVVVPRLATSTTTGPATTTTTAATTATTGPPAPSPPASSALEPGPGG